MQRCSRCRRELDVGEFDSDGHNGLRKSCQNCLVCCHKHLFQCLFPKTEFTIYTKLFEILLI